MFLFSSKMSFRERYIYTHLILIINICLVRAFMSIIIFTEEKKKEREEERIMTYRANALNIEEFNESGNKRSGH